MALPEHSIKARKRFKTAFLPEVVEARRKMAEPRRPEAAEQGGEEEPTRDIEPAVRKQLVEQRLTDRQVKPLHNQKGEDDGEKA